MPEVFFCLDKYAAAIYTLSLHDALPISLRQRLLRRDGDVQHDGEEDRRELDPRSEEHTSELQSHSELVCRLLLEKKNPKSSVDYTSMMLPAKNSGSE